MTTTEFTNGQIALACWRAAKSELHSVMLAVCQTFVNRAKAQDRDLYEVCAEWLTENPGEFPDNRDPQLQQMLVRLDRVIAGKIADKTDGALWFVPKSQLEPGMLQAFTQTNTIGQMVFLK